ncbi:hypothetical protein COA01_29505 [Bacillus cereus]|uniref:hypothetical protein n=1 Tax=Bacillus cereus TaxID=1396 RepID=UPI000BFB32EA|nr:hypothetical protein [Bacillus cereus]PGP14503.1 hypothetical protein COA01_29505 [Bacillus cereus]
MNVELKKRIQLLLESIQTKGLQWKLGSDVSHLKERKKRKNIPETYTVEDYNNLIINILEENNNEVYLYFLEDFSQDYFIFTDGKWIVIIGENCIMETAMISKNYKRYLSPGKGYTYIGTIKEVWG